MAKKPTNEKLRIYKYQFKHLQKFRKVLCDIELKTYTLKEVDVGWIWSLMGY